LLSVSCRKEAAPLFRSRIQLCLDNRKNPLEFGAVFDRNGELDVSVTETEAFDRVLFIPFQPFEPFHNTILSSECDIITPPGQKWGRRRHKKKIF